MNKIFILIFSIFYILFNQALRLSANDDTYINSSNITYNEKENVVELAKNSKINFKNINILIDKGIIDYNKNEFKVFGNFYIYEELTILSGYDLIGNTSLDIFSANNVSYIYNDDLKIDSDSLERDKNLIYFYNNFLTPCELEGYFNCPTWSLRIDKTEYNIEKDKFTHFDTFLQIADYKIFYLPYFTHYGAKAPRMKGFLTPTIEFTVGGSQGIKTPYYIPVNQSTDILIVPKIYISQNLDLLDQYELNTSIQNIRSGGNTDISITNIKNSNNQDINSTIRVDTKQVISKNNVISASGLFTNSISTTRSINENPITFEDIYLRLENYNLIAQRDYFKTELSSVESFDSTSINSIPVVPSIRYLNYYNHRNYSFTNEIDFTILKRNKSTSANPSESLKINLETELTNSSMNDFFYVFNKVILNNSINDYYFNNDKSLNHNSFISYAGVSSDLYFNNSTFFLPRVKFILPIQLNKADKRINEDSNSITFNYENQFSENRFFGNDLYDSSPRIVYGVESDFKLNNQRFNFKINQSFESNSNGHYSDKINQTSKISDFAFEANYEIDKLLFKIDTRFDQNNLSKKEMNYSLNYKDNFNLSLNFNETQSEAFEDLSNDTQYIGLGISKRVSDNINLSYSSSLDIKNNYDPFDSSIEINIFDECSQLDISYSNSRFNDNFNTQPKETISIRFIMDYLGFFGYQQSTDLFFNEPGEVSYGF
jgi:LPS-assembly protein